VTHLGSASAGPAAYAAVAAVFGSCVAVVQVPAHRARCPRSRGSPRGRCSVCGRLRSVARRVRNGACHRASPSGALAAVCGGGRRDLRLPGRTLKRNEAQEGVGRPCRQRRGPIPDSTMEQGLGAGAFDPPTSTDGTPATACRERGRWSRGNGRKARAAVTRYGCRRGVLRRVRILHCGEASWLAGLRSDARCGNAVDPRIGSGMQQARDSRSGGNRRGGAKPRGRNGTSEGGTSGAEARTGRPAREWTLHGHVDGGAKGALQVHVACIADGNPGEKVDSTRALGSASERSEGQGVRTARSFGTVLGDRFCGTPRGPVRRRTRSGRGR